MLQLIQNFQTLVEQILIVTVKLRQFYQYTSINRVKRKGQIENQPIVAVLGGKIIKKSNILIYYCGLLQEPQQQGHQGFFNSEERRFPTFPHNPLILSHDSLSLSHTHTSLTHRQSVVLRLRLNLHAMIQYLLCMKMVIIVRVGL